MAVRVIAGFGLIVMSLICALFGVHVRRLRSWDRPRWTLTRAYRRVWGPFHRLLLGAGIVLLAIESLLVALAAGAMLTTLWGWLKWTRSEIFAHRRLVEQISRIRRSDPSVDESEALGRALRERHPEWGPDLVEQMLRDYPTPRELARIVVRMERGWR